MNEEISNIIEDIVLKDPEKIVFSNPSGSQSDGFIKIIINKIVLKDIPTYQIEQYTEKQVFHRNISCDLLKDALIDLFEKPYRQVNVFAERYQMELRIGKKGNYHLTRKHIDTSEPRIRATGNNRQKNHIIKEGMAVPALIELGVFTPEQKVKNSMQDKFRQINRFTEFIDDCLRDFHKEKINIIDFGCGKSYLTFIVYHYLKEIRGIEPDIVGLDLKSDVIKKCNDLAGKFGYNGLRFEKGDINGFRAPFDKVDMVLTLHACDTATDYALYNAINWGADKILSVPCCQHEINGQIRSERFTALTKYGLIKERFSSLVTDAIRGCMLEYSGYRTDLMEFVDIEHSPKNVLIRAQKHNISMEKRKKALSEARNLCEEFGLDQTLMRLILKDTQEK
ncbi:MAG: SAM-dependent methyltransferase [Lachnospiraceae bacterium]|nr:SAM-dependent methyltransferase [Lachnospiraceae bacterium]